MINKQRLIKLTQKVLSFNSENPPGNELALAKFIAKDMGSLGLPVRVYTFKKNRPNVVVTLKGVSSRKQAAKESILITPHTDTVPIGTGWRYDPFGSQIVNGRIYGRGTTDDKGNLACCMEVLHSLIEDKVRLKHDVIMAATVDEETGSRYGIIPLLEKKILKPKAAVILDSTEYDSIIAQKGLFHFRIQILGKKAHGAYNWRGVNAIEIAARVITKIKKHKFKFKRHPLLRPPSINIGVIKGGDKVNVVPDFCEFSLDIRFLPGMTAQSILKDIKRIVKSEAAKFKIIIDNVQQPYEIDARDPLIKAYVNSAKKMGIKSILKGSDGATVITFFKKHNIPAFATGYGTHRTSHITDEYAKLSILHKGAHLLESFIKDYDTTR